MSFLIIEHRLELLWNTPTGSMSWTGVRSLLQGEPEKVVNDPIFFEVYIGATQREAGRDDILTATNIVAGYGDVHIVNGVNMRLEPRRQRRHCRTQRQR